MKDWNKYIFIIVLLALFYFFGNRLGKLVGKRNTEDERKKQQETDDFGFTQDSINRSNLTYPAEKYKYFADELRKCFKGLDNITFGIISNFEKVYSIFAQMQTDDDIKELIVAYGTPYNIPDWGFGWWNNLGRRNLVEVIQEHMNKKQIEKLNDLFAQKNIKFRF